MSSEKVDSLIDGPSHVVDVLPAHGLPGPTAAGHEEGHYLGGEGAGDSEDVRGADSEMGGWSTLLRYSKEFDEKMLKDWQDELANLLTFTGLFSAVVTGFVVVSILMLQEDTGQRTVALLGQISQQLSSLNIAQSMVNSTLQPDFATPLFVPDKAAININILWLSSLTLSLMAAFWTIAVQQWLRHIPLPQESTVRESIRLRQLRYDGIMSWKIPAIVSLLPLVVQIAVLLFLVGLLLLLRGLDHLVADTFAAIGGALFSLFLVTVPLPLVFPACPFKSPLLPTLWTIFQWTVVPALLTCIVVIVNVSSVLLFFLSPVLWQLLKFLHIVHDDYFNSSYHATILFGSKRFDIWTAYLARLLAFDASPHVFWRLRERWYVRRGKNGDKLDRSALSSVPIVVPEPDRGTILFCLQTLPENDRILAAIQWVCRDLGVDRSELRCWPMGVIPYLFGGTIGTLDQPTLARLRPILFEALPRDWKAFKMTGWKYFNSDKPEVFVMTNLSLLFRSIMPSAALPVDTCVLRAVVLLLSQIRDIQFGGDFGTAQDIVNDTKQCLWLPVTLLFRCYLLEGYVPSFQEATKAASVAQTIFRTLVREDNFMLDFAEVSAALPGALAATATALRAAALLSSPPSESPTSQDDTPSGASVILPALRDFQRFLASEDAARAFASQGLLRPVDTSELYLVDRLAVRSIAESLVKLAEHGQVGERADCPSRGVAEKLLEICSPSEDYADAVPTLREFVSHSQ